MDTAALSVVLDEFVATVTGDFAIDDILRQLALGVTRVLQLAGAGVAVPNAAGDLLHLSYATGAAVNELEKAQEALQEGPCRDSHASRRVINLADLRREGAWPSYQRAAARLGIRAVTTVPLRVRAQGWGVLDLYRATATPMGTAELTAATTVANLATSYLVVTKDRDTARQAQEQRPSSACGTR